MQDKIQKLLIFIIFVCSSVIIGLKVGNKKATDSYVRQRIVLLTDGTASCTGVGIKVSNQNFILSAGHCEELAHNGIIGAIYDDGSVYALKIVKVDKSVDLLLLDGGNTKFVEIAKKTELFEKVHMLAHGHHMPTYRKDGELLSEEDLDFFSPSGHTHERVVWSTIDAIPGCSGGPVLNEQGQLVGIVSLGGGLFGGIIPLHIIQDFLR